MKVDAFVFPGSPQPFDEDVVEEPTFPIHQDTHAESAKPIRPGEGRELAALIDAHDNQCFPKSTIKVHPAETERADRAIWVVETNDDSRTAFFRERVDLVTAAHCVNGATEIEVLHPLRISNRFKVEVMNLCSHRDLAILDCANRDF